MSTAGEISMSTILFSGGPHDGLEWITGDVQQRLVLAYDDGDVVYVDTGEVATGDVRIFEFVKEA